MLQKFIDNHLTPLSKDKNRILIIAAGISVVIVLVCAIVKLYLMSKYFDGFPANGAFQTYNPLARIRDGQFPGVDFNVFHGIGLSWITYPLFLLFGGTLFASNMSAGLVSLSLYAGGIGFFSYQFLRDKLVSLLAVLVFTASAVMNITPLSSLAESGNSNLGIRSSMSFLLMGLLLMLSRKDLSYLVALGLGICTGSLLFFDTSSFLPLLLLVPTVFLILRNKISTSLGYTLSFFVSVLVGILLFGSLGSNMHLGAVISYAFKDIPADQFWYFGAPPNTFLADWKSLFDVYTSIYGLSGWIALTIFTVSLILGGYCLYKLFKKSESRVDKIVGLSLIAIFLSGCIPSIGMSSIHYFFPYFKALGLVILLLLWRSKKTYFFLINSSMLYLSLVACVIGSVFYVYQLNLSKHANIEYTYIKEIDSFVSPTYKDARKLASITQGATLFSTYGTILEILRGEHQPSGVDYIIHALGENGREKYNSFFVRNNFDYVQTIRPDYFRGYEYWLWTANWNFYREVFKKYTPSYLGVYNILWKRSPPIAKENYTSGKCTISADFQSIEVVGKEGPSIGEIKLSYESDSKIYPIFNPILKRFSRVLVIPRGTFLDMAITLNPQKTEVQFPIFTQTSNSRLNLKSYPKSLTNIKAVSCTAEFYSASPELWEIIKQNKATEYLFQYYGY